MDRANYREVPYDYTQDEIKIKSEDGLEGNELDQLNANIKKLPESGDEVESDFKDPDATMFSLPDDSPRDEMMTDKMSFVDDKLVLEDISVEEFKKRQDELEKKKIHETLHNTGRNAFIEKWSYKKVRIGWQRDVLY